VLLLKLGAKKTVVAVLEFLDASSHQTDALAVLTLASTAVLLDILLMKPSALTTLLVTSADQSHGDGSTNKISNLDNIGSPSGRTTTHLSMLPTWLDGEKPFALDTTLPTLPVLDPL
jgi:hypothetical protein